MQPISRSKTACGIAVGFLVCILDLAGSAPAVAYGRIAHTQITTYALEYLHDADPNAHDLLLACTGKDPEIRGMKIRGKARPPIPDSLSFSAMLSEEVADVDDYYDLELVDVEGGFGDGGRDDPHARETWAIDDKAHYSEKLTANIFTALNHFIDIRKGPGEFDDYDGYSYQKGSGKKANNKLDSLIHYWYNDEYVHAPGQQWYQGCSPSVERYSFPADKGKYQNSVEEAKARFPVADSTGSDGKGLPFSVFMPVDNLARYWYGRFEATRDALCLGPVLHALQDASVPHHAAGTLGDWHSRYESASDAKVAAWLKDPDFKAQVRDLVEEWCKHDPSPPQRLDVGDWSRSPAINWRIDHLVTWLALNAYREFDETYGSFEEGYQYNEDSQKRLIKLAAAMSVLVLKKAGGCGTAPVTSPDAPISIAPLTSGDQMNTYDSLFSSSLDANPLDDGWVYSADSALDAWVEAGRSGRCLSTRDGMWDTPLIPVEPFHYYKVTFYAKSEERNYWAAIYHDSRGEPLVADHYWSVDKSDKWRKYEYCTQAEFGATHMRLRFQPLDGKLLTFDDVTVEPIGRPEVAAWADAVYAKIPPVSYKPSPARWRFLPRTMRKLREGGDLRIVALGDSIMNDTANSPFDVLIERMYPGAEIELITSVRGGTGASYYRDEGRVRDYIIRYNPDLLIIGGISNGDPEATRSVIRQVREEIDPEIIVASGAVCTGWDPTTSDTWTRYPDPRGEGYRNQSVVIARAERAEYLDMTGPWGEYIAGCGKPLSWFQRDITHANMRGAIVLAKILEAYFAPKD